MEEKKLIEFRNIVKSFDSQVVLKGINLDIYENEFVTLLGPSGCGKTTLLRILGGFLDADEGKVIFDNEDITDKPPYERELNTVFQKYALFPHLSVYENIAFGLKLKKMSKDIIDQKVMKMLKLIGLEGYEDKNTTLLSGGQQQRVAIARALVNEPKVLLLDEPLAALDFKRKSEIMPWLEKLKTNLKIPMLYVTHSAEEVLHLADNLIVMEDGRIKTSGALTDVLANINLPIKIGEDTGVLLKGKIVSKDKEWSLMTVDCGNIALHIGDNGQPIGSPASLRILAREVVFAKEKPSGLSVQNAFEGVVEEISVQKDSSGALIRANCSGQIIVGKLTRKALSELDIKEGSQIWLLIKRVALLSV